MKRCLQSDESSSSSPLTKRPRPFDDDSSVRPSASISVPPSRPDRIVTAESGRSMLSLRPYEHSFETNAKQRWYGRTLLSVFCSEFNSNDEAYFRAAIEMGTITVNGRSVTTAYVVRNGDNIVHRTCRHEPPVPLAPIRVVFFDGARGLLVVEKPCGMPVHPSGSYHYNSLASILRDPPPIGIGLVIAMKASESGKKAKKAAPEPLPVPLHRLDRLTSGLLIYSVPSGSTCSSSLESSGGSESSSNSSAAMDSSPTLSTPCMKGPFEINADIHNDLDGDALKHVLAYLRAASSHRGQQDSSAIAISHPVSDGSVMSSKTAAHMDAAIPLTHTFKRYLALLAGEFPLPPSRVVTTSASSPSRDFDTSVGAAPLSNSAASSSSSSSSTPSDIAQADRGTALSIRYDLEATLNCPYIKTVLPRFGGGGSTSSSEGNSNSSSSSSSSSGSTSSHSLSWIDCIEAERGGRFAAGSLPCDAATYDDGNRTVDSRVDYAALSLVNRWLAIDLACTVVDHANGIHSTVKDSTSSQKAGALAPNRGSAAAAMSSEMPPISTSKEDERTSPTAKPSLTLFRRLWYDSARNVTCVEARPITGRTHQIRLHAAALGLPIYDDPMYCEEAAAKLSKQDSEKKTTTLASSSSMCVGRAGEGLTVMSAPFMLASSGSSSTLHTTSASGAVSASSSQGGSSLQLVRAAGKGKIALGSDICGEIDKSPLPFSVESGPPPPPSYFSSSSSSSNNSSSGSGSGSAVSLVQSLCASCKSGNNSERHSAMQSDCSGISLHSLEYIGNGWSFSTACNAGGYPEWARKSSSVSSHTSSSSTSAAAAVSTTKS